MTQPLQRHVVLIAGGGAGGLTVAALLKRARPDLDIAVIDPAEHHAYQPAWTLVGAGEFDIDATLRPMASVMPRGVTWIRQRITGFAPDQSQIMLDDGRHIGYRFLVMAMGLQLDWHKIPGLTESLGRNGVCSNYRFDLAPYTWQTLRQLPRGGEALFTQPSMPIKCAGAPQKILYMAADHCRQAGNPANLHFFTPGPAMFGVPFYAKALNEVVAHYGVHPHFGHELIAVDGPAQRARFKVTEGERQRELTLPFDMLHVVPPQSAPDVIQQSPLADRGGWVSVDKHTLRHTCYDQIFGLGDCTSTPNSKTAAAVRAQAPVLVANLLQQLDGHSKGRRYDGYASCPLTTSKGRIMLAEFGYDGVVMPSFPLDPRVPRRSYWWLKKYYLPALYWRMLKGNLGPDWHTSRSFPETLPAIQP